jgi:hypothetical protein
MSLSLRPFRLSVRAADGYPVLQVGCVCVSSVLSPAQPHLDCAIVADVGSTLVRVDEMNTYVIQISIEPLLEDLARTAICSYFVSGLFAFVHQGTGDRIERLLTAQLE